MNILIPKDKINTTNLMFILDNYLIDDNAIANGFFMSLIVQQIFWQIKYHDDYNYNYNYHVGTGKNLICDLKFEMITSDSNLTTGYNGDSTRDGSACAIVLGNNRIGTNLYLDNHLYNGVNIFGKHIQKELEHRFNTALRQEISGETLWDQLRASVASELFCVFDRQDSWKTLLLQLFTTTTDVRCNEIHVYIFPLQLFMRTTKEGLPD